jgi:hypothetical protein
MSFKEGTQRGNKMKKRITFIPVKSGRQIGSLLPGMCVAVCIFIGVVQQGFAQDAALTGVWKHSQDANEQAQRYAAIDEATKGMNRMMRGRAREMLRAKTVPESGLNLSDGGNRVTFAGQNHRVTFNTDGSPTRVQSERGTATARAKRENGKLVVTSQAQNGVQTTVYSLSKDRTRLVLDVSVSGSKLKNPVKFRTTYHRASK